MTRLSVKRAFVIAAIAVLGMTGCGEELAPPAVALSVDPPVVSAGASATLRWSSTDATSCAATGAWSGARPVSGSQAIGALQAASSFTLTCTGDGGSATRTVTVEVERAPSAPPIVTLSASPTSLPVGGAATLTWSANGAASCTASGAWSGDRPTSGAQSTGALATTSSYSLTCSGAGGTATQSVTVAVANTPPPPMPTVALSASPPSVSSGGSATLVWSSTDASACSASGAWSGTKATAGSQTTGALTATSTYTLSCTGAGGTATRSITVVVASVPAPSLALSASPTLVGPGAASTLSWSSANATACSAAGAWSGPKATSGTQSTGALAATASFALTCVGAGGEVTRSVTVSVAAPAPSVALSASPLSVAYGSASTLTWSATDATGCTASAAPANVNWSGARPTSGSASTGALTAASNTFTLTCSGGDASASQSVTVVVAPAAGGLSGLDFPGNAGVRETMRFRFLNPLAIYPATYIWRAYPRRQAGYYTTFFWGNDGPFWWAAGSPDSYYGAHPYPDPAPSGSVHDWEIAVEGGDFVNGRVVYDRWYTQALVVWADAGGRKHHVFYWDLPNTDAGRRVEHVALAGYGNRAPPVPALTWGDAPWAPGQEVYNGVLRGIQIYTTHLSVSDLLSEVSAPLSTAAGAANIWYLNLNPTPTDISDKSGRGNHPAWVGSERPRLWSGP